MGASTTEQPATSQPTPSLMPLPAVEAKTGLKKTTIYALMKSEGTDRFPSPIRFLKRSVLWVSTDVDDWINARIRESLKVNKQIAKDL